LRVELKPALKEVTQFVREGLNRKEVVIIIGNCEVRYEGRAYSRLSSGTRILIIKEDRALILHRPKGFEPVNWQPSGSIIVTDYKGGKFILRSFRRKVSETIEVTFDRVDLIVSARMLDEGEFLMYGNEEDLKRAILIKPDLIEEGLRVIFEERRSGSGYADLCCLDAKGRLVIVELKKERANREAVIQLLKYVNYYKKNGSKAVRGILVSPSISKGALKLLKELGLEYRKINLRKCLSILKKFDSNAYWSLLR